VGRVFSVVALSWIVVGVPAQAQEADQEIVVYGKGKMPAAPSLNIQVDKYELNTKRFVFPTGLRVLMQADDTVPVVAVTAVTDHGSGSDPIGLEGMAHLYEHLWFRTEHGDLPPVWGLVQNELGCGLNAYTNYDVTAYTTVCPSEQLAYMLKLESLRVTSSMEGVPDDGVTAEIEVVRNEIRFRAENGNIPFFALLEPLGKHSYPDYHPYHRPIAGGHDSVRSITPDDLRGWTSEMYRPETTTIMVVGDFDINRGMDLLIENLDLKLFHPDLTEEHVVKWPRPGVKSPNPNNPHDWRLVLLDPTAAGDSTPVNAQSPLAPRRDMYTRSPLPARNPTFGTYTSTVDDPTVVVSWTMPPAYQGNDTLHSMMGNVLSNIVGFGLDQIDDPDLDEFGGCGAMDGKFATLMICSASIKNEDRAERLAETMVDQVSTLWNPDLRDGLEGAFTSAKMSIMADILRSLDLYASVGGGRANDIAVYAHFTDNPKYHSSKIEELNQLTPGNVSQVSEQFLQRNRVNMLLVKPIERDELQEESSEGESDHYGSKITKAEYGLVDVATVDKETLRGLAYEPDQAKVLDYELPSGLRVVIVPHGEAPVVRATLIANGGSSHDPLDEMDFAYRFSDSDTKDALRIAGQWYGGMGSTYETLGLEGSSGNLDAVLWMLRDGVEKVEPDMANRPKWVKDGKKRIIKDFGKMDFHVGQIMRTHVNPGHHLSQSRTHEDYDRLATMGSGDVREILDSRWNPGNATLLVVGRFDGDRAEAMVNKYWGGWAANRAPYVSGQVEPPNAAPERRVLVLDDEGKTQTTVQLRCPVRYDGGEPSASHNVLSTVLRNEAFATLREAAGVVYSPYGGVTQSPGNAYAVFSADVQNDAAAFTLETYYKILENIEAGEYDATQVKQEVYAAVLRTVLNRQSVRQVSDTFEETLGNGASLDFWSRYADELVEVSAQSMGDVLKGCTDHSIAYLSGPKDEIVALLEEREIAHEVIDWEQRGRDMHAAAEPKGFEKAEKKRLKAEAKKEEEEAKEAAEEAEEGDTDPEEGDAEPEEDAAEDAPSEAPEEVDEE
jgi:zinc protease